MQTGRRGVRAVLGAFLLTLLSLPAIAQAQGPSAPGLPSPEVVDALEKYAGFLREIGRETDAAVARMRVERLRQMRVSGVGATFLGFNPARELRDYAVLLRQRNRLAEATAMEALAEQEGQRQVAQGKAGQSAASGPLQYPAWRQSMFSGLQAATSELYPDAQGFFETAVKQAQGFGPDDVRLAFSLAHLARVLAAQGKHDDADRITEQALGTLEKPASARHVMLGQSLQAIAVLHVTTEFRPAKALAYFQRALPLLEKTLAADHPILGVHLAGLAAAHLALAQPEQARGPLERALAIAGKALGRDHVPLAIGLNRVVGVYIEQRSYAEAHSVSRRVVETMEKIVDPGHPDWVRVLQAHVRVLRHLGRLDEAAVVQARLRAKAAGPSR